MYSKDAESFSGLSPLNTIIDTVSNICGCVMTRPHSQDGVSGVNVQLKVIHVDNTGCCSVP